MGAVVLGVDSFGLIGDGCRSREEGRAFFADGEDLESASCLHRVCDVAGCFDTELLDYLDAQLPNQALESKERHPPRGHSISSFFLQLAVGGATSPGKAPL